MSRRDTIIIAVLINAGLLIVLFASALKSNSHHEELALAPPPVVRESINSVFKKETGSAPADEVDLALNQVAQSSSTSGCEKQALTPSSSLQETLPFSSSVSHFAEDLKAIAIPEVPQTSQSQLPTVHSLVAPITPPHAVTPEFLEFKVKKGDVLEKIARQHHTTVAEIMKANQLTNTNLRIGQVLKIPNKSLKVAQPSTIVFSPQTSGSSHVSNETIKYYTVKKGDNPSTIAVKNHLKVEDLLKLNNMTEEQTRRLKPGDRLRIQ